MDAKLTLNLNKQVIEEAKEYARENSISLSRLIENLLKSLTKKDQGLEKISPLVESLTGVLPAKSSEGHMETRYEHLRKKHS